jgi:hypothetical protein
LCLARGKYKINSSLFIRHAASARGVFAMPNLKRNNHYLPQCYQQGFTDSTGRVWVKFANKEKPERRRPESVGRMRSLYIRNRDGVEDDKIEDFFNVDIETPFASLSRRIKDEKNEFRDISGKELGILSRFVVSQTLRTIAHKYCIDEQAGGPVDRNTFLRVMTRKMWTLTDAFLKNQPEFQFYTTLPTIGAYFLTGDNPVLVIEVKENNLWAPATLPTQVIIDVAEIVKKKTHSFWVALTPYVCVSVRMTGGEDVKLPPKTMEMRDIRLFNDLIRDQCREFVLARDKEMLN